MLPDSSSSVVLLYTLRNDIIACDDTLHECVSLVLCVIQWAKGLGIICGEYRNSTHSVLSATIRLLFSTIIVLS